MQVMGSYIYIPVSDLRLSAEWYKENFGLITVKEDDLYLELRSASGVRVMLIDNEQNITSHMNYSTGTQAAYGFVIHNITEVFRDLVAKGIEVTPITDYQGLSFKFFDPDRNIIELWGDYPDVGWTIFEPLRNE
ncbi:VOC family protein [Paenibacillus sp. N3/727]|uniref:VOC family protein n=1 Tax=Paenibacillus sp. N3/727 TaxID=2925845 RepID=UPI001F52F7E1|nr:VOC family protein [Paenibacillus sp. N3/727]UNK16982.1 VOC family protein [Paenibacillus sp. N3/727]